MHRQITILTVLMCFLAASAQAAQISVEPAYQEVFKGDTITVNITVCPEESEIYAASYTLYFNNTLLNATSQIQGPFLTQDGGSATVWWNEIDNTTGKVEYAESRMGTDFGVTGSGVLSTITFEIVGDEGVTQLGITDYEGLILHSNTSPVLADINNGSVDVKKGICGDVNNDGEVDMTDVMTLWYDIADYPTPGAYTISNTWAANVNCDEAVDMTDVMTLWYDIADYPTQGAYEIGCCGG